MNENCVFCAGTGTVRTMDGDWAACPDCTYYDDEWYEEDNDYEDERYVDIGGVLFDINDGRPVGGVY